MSDQPRPIIDAPASQEDAALAIDPGDFGLFNVTRPAFRCGCHVTIYSCGRCHRQCRNTNKLGAQPVLIYTSSAKRRVITQRPSSPTTTHRRYPEPPFDRYRATEEVQ